jgi:uncharacterized protein (TIGR00725 family)
MENQKITISVIGGHDAKGETAELAYKVGKIVAQEEAVLVCGGLGGVMTFCAKGAKENGGTTIGILPGKEKSDANPFIDIALPTSMGYSRNCIVACSADIIIALPGSEGTNTEICYGLVFKRPVIDLGNWHIDGMIKTKSLLEAKIKIKQLIKKIKHQRSNA